MMSKKNSPFIEILNCLRRNIIKAAFVDKAYGTNISNALTRILDEYFKRGTPSLPELSKILGLNKSTISRGYLSLKKHKLVTFSFESEDKRRKILKITEEGKNFLKLHNDFTYKQTKEQISKLAKAELHKFIEYLEVFSGKETPLGCKDVDKIILCFRRLTDNHGVVSGDYLGSGYSTSDWVLLAEIEEKSPIPKILSQTLNMPQSTLSQKLAALDSKRLIRYTASSSDKRSKHLNLTDKGKKALDNIHNRAEAVFSKELSGLNKNELREFIDFFKKYTS